MVEKDTSLSRRKVLQTTSVALGSLGVVNTVSAKEKLTSRTIHLDTSSIDHVDESQITILSDGNYAISAGGSEVPISNAEIPVVRISTKYQDGSPNSKNTSSIDFQPEQLTGTIKSVTPSQTPEKSRRGGGSKKKFSSGQDPAFDSASTTGGVTAQSTDTDSGTDYTTDYEAGLQVTSSEAYLSDVNHGQTSRWSSSGGEVNQYSDRYWCWYVGPNAGDAEHQAGGFQVTDFSGDTLRSKSFSQYHREGTTDLSYYVYLYATLTMNPDGTMDWYGQVTTQGNTDVNPPASSFELKTQYWSYCKNWAT